MEWKTIDSAPKRGWFLAWEGGEQYVCEWGDWFMARTGPNGKREDVYGWVKVGGQPGSQARPTHWKPLREPPGSTSTHKGDRE